MERIVKRELLSGHRRDGAGALDVSARQYGAIIVRNDEIVATGYNGAPRGRKKLLRPRLLRARADARAARRKRYELCRSVHAEANAIISASRNECIGGDIYLVGHDAKTGAILSDATSCSMCGE